MRRRNFLRGGMIAATTAAVHRSGLVSLASEAGEATQASPYEIQHLIPARHYDGKTCWCHPRAGIIPGAGKSGMPRIVMTMNTLDVSGSDVFKGLYSFHTDDKGQTWTVPEAPPGLAVRYRDLDNQKRPVAVSDFWPGWHVASQTLLATGHNVVYTPDWKVSHPRPRETTWATYDARTNRWSDWQTLAMPDPVKFHDAGAGCVQRYDEADGSILLPIYYRPPGQNSRVTVVRCRFDGAMLSYLEHGNELSREDKTRGLGEPSLIKFDKEYFLTIRNDERGYVSRSRDGLNFEPIQPWRFDDGQELGSYNTQQHWIANTRGLFLVYTRKGANNDHVFRHRAPLFMARVDPRRLCVLRETERVVVPERGARLGNFGVTHIDDNETWVTVAEWMQTWGPNYILPVDNPHGSDGSVWVARILWK